MIVSEGKYDPIRNIRLESVHPIIEGYKTRWHSAPPPG